MKFKSRKHSKSISGEWMAKVSHQISKKKILSVCKYNYVDFSKKSSINIEVTPLFENKTPRNLLCYRAF